MLVLQQKLGDRVFIDTSDGRIVVEIVRWRRHSVRVGYTAPQCVRILREEIADSSVDGLGPGEGR